MAKYDRLTLDEILVLSNKEILINWTRFASFIMAVDKIDWNEASKQALAIYSDKEKANELINEYRKRVESNAGVTQANTSKSETKEKSTQEEEPAKSTKKALTEYHHNFNRLKKIVPDLVERLSQADLHNKGTIYGKSIQTGYMDFSVELTYQNKDSYYLALAHYYEQNGDLVPDPDMVVRVDLKNETVEALAFQNAYYYREVYDDIYKRTMVNEKERKAQNEFLSEWLLNLGQQGHEVVLRSEDEDQTEELADSDLEIEFLQPEGEEQPNKSNSEKVETKKAPHNRSKRGKSQEPAPTPIEEKKIEKILHWEKFIALIQNAEKLSNSRTAEKKAEELIKSSKALDYVIQYHGEIQLKKVQDLFKQNYELLLIAIPQLIEVFEIHPQINFNPENKDLPLYVFEDFQKEGTTVRRLTIVEKDPKKSKSGSSMVIVLNGSTRRCWIEEISNKFMGLDAYNYKKTKLNRSDYFNEERYNTNLVLRNLLFHLLQNYQLDEAIKNLASREEWLNHYKENAETMPHFEAGHVQLTEQHIKAGITQDKIDWVNENKTGLLIRPAKSIVYNTIDKKMDKRLFAQKPGLRLSKFGGIYYEGRSNRSDKGNKGL